MIDPSFGLDLWAWWGAVGLGLLLIITPLVFGYAYWRWILYRDHKRYATKWDGDTFEKKIMKRN